MKYFLIIAALICQDGVFSQDFIHDSVRVSGNSLSVVLKAGITPNSEILKIFPDARVKNKISRYGPHSFYKKTLITADNGKLTFELEGTSESRKESKNLDCTLNAIFLENGSSYCLNEFWCSSTTMAQVEQMLIDNDNQDVLEKSIETQNGKVRSYHDIGFTVHYMDTFKTSVPKRILWTESGKAIEKNFRLYRTNSFLKSSPDVAKGIIDQCLSLDTMRSLMRHKEDVKITLSGYLSDDFQLFRDHLPPLAFKSNNGDFTNPDIIFREFDYSTQLSYKQTEEGQSATENEIISVNYDIPLADLRINCVFLFREGRLNLLSSKYLD